MLHIYPSTLHKSLVRIFALCRICSYSFQNDVSRMMEGTDQINEGVERNGF